MIKPKLPIVGAVLICLMTELSFAAGPKLYRVTGEVLQVSSDLIVIRKGNKTLEFARDPSTRVKGDLKPGSHVTIRYRKHAVSVEVEPAGAPGKVKP